MTVSDGIKGICQHVNAQKKQNKINDFVNAVLKCHLFVQNRKGTFGLCYRHEAQ